MNEDLIKQLGSMLSNVEDKKLSQSMEKAIDMLKNHDISELKDAILNKDFSNIKGAPKDMDFDIGKMIDALPEAKKRALSHKFNSPEVQKALKTDRNKAIEILMKAIADK